jgi:hypothetical protein
MKTVEDIEVLEYTRAKNLIISNLFPETLKELETELIIHSKDGRSDPGFRFVIAMAQVGSLAAHFTHDPKENPIARPYGTPLEEKHDAGHAIVQLLTYCALRGINLQEAVNMALVHLRDRDFIKREAKKSDSDDIIVGQTAMTGIVRGKAFVILSPDVERIVSSPRFSDWERGSKKIDPYHNSPDC